MPPSWRSPAAIDNVHRHTTDNGRVTETVDSDLADVVRRARDRDVARAITALTRWPHPDASQRAAIADHVSWMSRSVVQQDGSAQGAAAELTTTAQRYRLDAGARAPLVAALDASSVAGSADGVLEPRTNAQRAATACWLEDEADDDARALIRNRFHTRASRLLAFTARRSYRSEAYRRWYLPEHSGLSRHLTCRVERRGRRPRRGGVAGRRRPHPHAGVEPRMPPHRIPRRRNRTRAGREVRRDQPQRPHHVVADVQDLHVRRAPRVRLHDVR